MRLFSRYPKPAPDPPENGASAPAPVPAPRVLFLDDDPARAEVFLVENPSAVWVQTAAECIARLVERWDEVHLDHDLGGEHFVDQTREDCGMEVVRWLCLQPRPHLRKTRFRVHTHNPNAAMMMGMQMMMSGFAVTVRPFGEPEPFLVPEAAPPPRPSPLAALARWLRRVYLREVDEVRPLDAPELFLLPEVEPPPRLSPLAALGQRLRRVFRREGPDDPALRFESTDRSPLEPFFFDWPPLPAESRVSGKGQDPEAEAPPGPSRP
jgi:hypothetical protein